MSSDEFKISGEEGRYEDYQFPKVTIVIPTLNCSEKIALTVESVMEQKYPDFELIVIDAGSTDRTIEVIKNTKDERIRIYTVSGYYRYEMLNKGIAQAKGEYINFLFPGDFYIHNHTLQHMMGVALDHQKPDMVFCGTFLRDGKMEPKILLREFSLELLRKGQQPTSLQSCWFLTDTVRDLGKFNTTLTLRGGYDLMCRMALEPDHTAILTKRVLIDYDLRFVTLKMVRAHFIETLETVFTYFGLTATAKWLCCQKDVRRIMRHWWKSVKIAFLGS